MRLVSRRRIPLVALLTAAFAAPGLLPVASLCVTAAMVASACASAPTVPLRLEGKQTDALVTINDQYVGKLGEIARRTIKLPPGTYRLTVEQVGFFPFDRIVEVGAEPLVLVVELEQVPD